MRRKEDALLQWRAVFSPDMSDDLDPLPRLLLQRRALDIPYQILKHSEVVEITEYGPVLPLSAVPLLKATHVPPHPPF